MTRYASPAVRGERPWGRNEGGAQESPREAAPRQEAAYRCEKGCKFSVPLAADAKPPTGWDCRCGGVARLDGAPDGACPEANRPGYGMPPGGYRKGDQAEGMDPWGQLMKRRSIPALEALLAERIEAMRRAGASR